VEDATRREFLAVLGAAGLLAGCGGTPGPAATSPAGRTVSHEFGTTVLDGVPRRVVTPVDSVEFDRLLALGVTPAATGLENGVLMPWTEGVDTSGIETFDNFYRTLLPEVDREQLAVLRPDLLLVSADNADPAVVEQAGTIAPVVGAPSLAPGPFGWWEDVLALVAEVVDRAERVPGIVAEVETALAAGRDALSRAGARQVTLISVYDESGAYVFTDVNPQGALLAELGLTRPPAQREQFSDDRGGFELSVERLGILDSDLVLVMDYVPEATDALETQPLFQAVPAVADGRHVRLSGEVSAAMFAHSPLTLPWAVDQITHLLD
jgi:iron complex transport system substrate-binding protein